MDSVQILDCTLRDGGYVNKWDFDELHVKTTIRNLCNAGIEIIECGFLDQKTGADSTTRFEDIKTLNDILAENFNPATLHVAMVEYGKYDVSSLPPAAEVQGIRYSFRKSDRQNIYPDLKSILDKGYKLFIQPISTISYNVDELIALIESLKEYDVYAFYIVDTQGSMFKEDFRKLYYVLNDQLDAHIKIGFHSHNNIQLSYSIAMDFIEISYGRDIIIDSSIYGMGRGAGNLNTELLTDYINNKVPGSYDVDPVLMLIDEYYYSLYINEGWGYSLAHFLSASIGCHPDYATYILNKKNLSILIIKDILSRIPKTHLYEFDQSVIEGLYYEHNESIETSLNEPVIDPDKNYLIAASGPSSQLFAETINDKSRHDQVILMNHVNPSLNYDYTFFNSQKRYEEFRTKVHTEKLIVSSNINLGKEHKSAFVISYEDATNLGEVKNDNSSIMFMRFLSTKGVAHLSIAGLDGYSLNRNNYSYSEFDAVTDQSAMIALNDYILSGLKRLSEDLTFNFIGDSIFKSQLKPRVIGVIPARLASTRLANKPLEDIDGLPMVVHVFKRAMLSDILDEVIVATDSEKIVKVVEEHGGKALMTSPEHPNGTLRMQEVAEKVPGDLFVLINGDEPLVLPEHIEASVHGLLNSDGAVASILVSQYSERNNPSNFKVAMNLKDEVLYISRNDIPSDARSTQKPMWKAYHLVSYRKDFLDTYAHELSQTELDSREMDDQLRIIEYGYKIQAVRVETDAISVDTQEDLVVVREKMKNDSLKEKYQSAVSV